MRGSRCTRVLRCVPVVPMFPCVLAPVLIGGGVGRLRRGFSRVRGRSELMFRGVGDSGRGVGGLSVTLGGVTGVCASVGSGFVPAVRGVLSVVSMGCCGGVGRVPSSLLCLLQAAAGFLGRLTRHEVVPGNGSDSVTSSIVRTDGSVSMACRGLEGRFCGTTWVVISVR